MSPEAEKLAGEVLGSIPNLSSGGLSDGVRKFLENLSEMGEVDPLIAQIFIALLDELDDELAINQQLRIRYDTLGEQIAELRGQILDRSGKKSIIS